MMNIVLPLEQVTRVMVTRNVATQIGIYNGATGVVVRFRFHTVKTFHQ
jgi:hypothetical protein